MANHRLAARSVVAGVVASTSLLVSPGAFAQVASGEGDGLKIAVDPATRVITGYFQTGTGDDGHGGPQFSCIFFLRGKAEGKPPYAIATWFPPEPKDAIEGTLRFSSGVTPRTVTIRLPRDHGGCGMAEPFSGPEGTTMMLDDTRPWTSVRVVSAKRAWFHPGAVDAKQPPSGAPSHAYVVLGDAVGVTATQPGWVLAGFTTAGGKTIQGWLKEGDLFDPSGRQAR